MREQSSDDGTLFDLLVRWEALRMEGREIAPDLICHCAGMPELAPELERRARQLRALEPTLGPETPGQAAPSTTEAGCGNTIVPTSSRYRRLRLYARGGLGEVHVANDSELHREVALKELQENRAKSPANQARFLREAEITGSLEHPGIVPVYGLGRHPDGRPFYAMRLVRGESLAVAIKRLHDTDVTGLGARDIELRKHLRRFLDVCDAIAYAHSRGVIHRDLKPDNIMLGPFGETLVVDWGVAKVVGRPDAPGDESGLGSWSAKSPAPDSLPGSVVGTPSFMSPEQASGLHDRVGPASDIYSLGATLHNLLTGKVPLASQQPAVALDKIKRGEFASRRARNRRVPKALEAICQKAMALSPENRYVSARALAEDIERWLADEPVRAWREPWPVRASRWARRHRPAVSATAAACVVALFLGGIGLYSYQKQARQEMVVAAAAIVRAEQARSDARATWSSRLDATLWTRVLDLAAHAAAFDSVRLPAELRRRLRGLSSAVKAEAAESQADALLLKNLAAVRSARNDPQYDAPGAYGHHLGQRGLLIEAGNPGASTAWDQSRPALAAVEIASYLDDWALLLREKGDPRTADRITARARALDPDPWRNALRDSMTLRDRTEKRQTLARLAETPGIVDQPSPTLTLLASALRGAGDWNAAIALMESARFRNPGDPWVHQELGLARRQARPPRTEDALRAFAAATALRPEMGYELAKTLEETGRTGEAISILEDVTRRQPEVVYFLRLGQMKASRGRPTDAREMFQQAAVLCRSGLPSGHDDWVTHEKIALSLQLLGDLAGAIAEHREAVRLKPDRAEIHCNLGVALCASGDRAGAICEQREAIRLKPDFAEAHHNLGSVLSDSGDLAGATTEYRRAIGIKPDYAVALMNLGIVLRKSGDLPEAVARLEEAVRLKPDLAEARDSLGYALSASGNLAGAIVQQREAIRLRPDYALAHCNLGLSLRRAGQYQEALVSMERGHALGARQPGWQHPSAEWVKQCRRLVELDGKLANVISGKVQPADTTERAELASVARAKGLYAAAARLFAEAFAEQAWASVEALLRRANGKDSRLLAPPAVELPRHPFAH
jgi:tetratricopeptide (TPR) repeat protein